MNYISEAICHDHFSGSWHCVECDGPCKLIGVDLAYTALVRSLFEAEALHGQRVAYMAQLQLEGAGVDVSKMRERAQQWAKDFVNG